ncbi:MAG: flagellar basal body P-ring formation chaperone FlgA [Caldimonas sp.]
MAFIAALGFIVDPLARLTARGVARTLAWLGAAAVAAALFGWPAQAGAAEPAAALDPVLAESVRSLALGQVAPVAENDTEGSTGARAAPRVEVVIGQLDPRLHLAPCQRIEPYLPPNARLWGKARIGLRCTEGATAWNVYLPITVKVFGHAFVMPAGGQGGSIVTAADLVEAEVDLAEEHTAAIVDQRQAVGRVLAQAVRPGQTLRQGHLKVRQWFTAGETVKVVAVGAGFSLESEGQALSNGIEGQPARVRTEGGRVVTGQPTGERRLELTL